MRKFFDHSDPVSRQQFAARFDALPDPLAKVESAFGMIEQLAKVVKTQQDELNRLLGRDSAVARRYADALFKRAVAEQRERDRPPELLAKAAGAQPPLIHGPRSAREWDQRGAEFLTHFRSH
jgi:hypothetical protein